MVHVKDNFLDKEFFNKIVDEFTSPHIPYYLQHGVVNANNDKDIQFTHQIYYFGQSTSHLFDMIQPLYKKLNVSTLLTCKVNFLYRTDKVIQHGFHIDIDDTNKEQNKNYESKTAILYLNTNNGYTIFKNGEKVYSVANRLVKFSNNLEHSGATNTCKTPYRLALIINYLPTELYRQSPDNYTAS